MKKVKELIQDAKGISGLEDCGIGGLEDCGIGGLDCGIGGLDCGIGGLDCGIEITQSKILQSSNGKGGAE